MLARRMQKVFLSADVLGHRPNLSCAWRDSAVARARPAEEAPGDAAGWNDGAACSVRIHDWFSVAGCSGGIEFYTWRNFDTAGCVNIVKLLLYAPASMLYSNFALSSFMSFPFNMGTVYYSTSFCFFFYLFPQ